MPSRETQDVADIHQRLDFITRQIEQIARPAPRNDAPRGEPGVARQLNDAISRLDARLSQISNPPAAKNAQFAERQRQADTVDRAAAQLYRPAPAPESTQSHSTQRSRKLSRARTNSITPPCGRRRRAARLRLHQRCRRPRHRRVRIFRSSSAI